MKALILFGSILFGSMLIYASENSSIAALREKLKALKAEEDTVMSQLHKLEQEKKNQKILDPFQTRFDIPRFHVSPKIDGILSPGEWDSAIEIPTTATSSTWLMKERPGARFMIGYDSDYFYMAGITPLRPGEKMLRLCRSPEPDNVNCLENSVELYIDRSSFGSHQSLCRWQFMGNGSGNKYEREDQHQIGQNHIDWNGKWHFSQSLDPSGKYWYAEMAIPRQTVYQNAALKDGDIWKIGFAANLQNPWTFSGFYRWNIPVRFTEDAPAVKLFNILDIILKRKISFGLKIQNLKKELNGRVCFIMRNANGGQEVFRQEWPLKAAAGTVFEQQFCHDFSSGVKDMQNYAMSIIVNDGERDIYVWTRNIRFGDPANKIGVKYEAPASAFPVSVQYAPVSNAINITADKYDLPQNKTIIKALIEVRKKDKRQIIASGEISKFSYDKGEITLPVPKLMPGEYTVRVSMLDQQKRITATQEKNFNVRDLKEFPWIGNQLGMERIVPSIFQPLSAKGDILHAYRKTIQTGNSGLPRQITVTGQKLLSAPISISGTMGGKDFTLREVNFGKNLISADAFGAEYSGQLAANGINAEVKSCWEYDSTAKVVIIFSPAKPEGKVLFERLSMRIPFTSESSLNFMTCGLNMRLSCHAGRIPAGPGQVWTSKEVPAQKMTKGSFVPIVWLGNRSCGLTWFAEGDRDWWVDDDKPALEIVRRKDGGADLFIHFAANGGILDRKRTIEFGLNINPVRKLSEHRQSALTFGYYRERGLWVPGKSKRHEFALRYPQSPEKSRALSNFFHQFGEIYAPYTEMTDMDIPEDEAEYFAAEFRGRQLMVFPTKTFTEAAVYWSEKAMRECGIDGYYFDNLFLRMSDSPANSRAYYLEDGRIQGAYCIWAWRDHIRRLRVLAEKNLGPGKFRLCIHNTRFQFAPVMGFADLAMGGEMETPRMGTPDFMAMYPRDFMEVMYNPGLWGYKLSHLYHFDYHSYRDRYGNWDKGAADKVHRSAVGTMLLHGVEFFHNLEYRRNLDLLTKYRLFKKLAGKSLQFIPWWESSDFFQMLSSPDKCGVSAWKSKNGLLFVLTNFSEKEQIIRTCVDFPKMLDVPQSGDVRMVLDFETMSPPGHIFEKQLQVPNKFPGNTPERQSMIKNIMRVKVPPRDFRLIYVHNTAPAHGVQF